MSEPDNPRWLNDVGDELRKEVPVRAAWRAGLLDELASAPPPKFGDDIEESTPDLASHARRRRIVLSPFAGIAAALVFVALGAGATLLTVSLRDQNDANPGIIASQTAPTTTTTVASNGVSGERKTVKFELAAPRASHVTLVGSFNEWNPVATPLERDPSTGKWIVSVRLPPGRHVYAFVVDGDVTADPAAPRTADDDFGSSNSVLLVSGRSS